MPIIRRTTSRLLSLLLPLGAASALPAHALDAIGVRAVPTYEAVGLYWDNPGAGSNGCDVRFRVQGTSAWRQGLALWYDAASSQCRGSLVDLAPGTPYEAQLGVNGAFAKSIAFTTWPNSVPVAQTIKVPSGTATLDITAGGSPSGYVVYDGTGSTLDARNGAPSNITVNASYVVVRGFTLRGAQKDAILIDPNQHDVVIEDNDISGWGRTRDGTWGADMDSGIRAICRNEELTRVTIQRNRIHDPRYPANSWAVAHPAGPQGITFSYCGGNHVFRWNEIYSAKNHFNDGMGGEDNFSTSGFPNADSDVYGNRVEMAWDDGLEIEGGDRNVRVWGNYVDRTATAIASTVDAVGPLYIFRNVWNRNQFIEGAGCDSDQKQPMFKSGSSADFGSGRRYLFHNTMLQAQQAGCQYGLGGGAGVGGTGSTQLVRNTVSMNNIYQVWKANGAFYQLGSDVTFRNDMTNAASSPEVAGIVATPQYAPNNGWQSGPGGLYQLAAGTPGYDQGVRIPNFNDGYLGNAPDVGAAEGGAAAMKFGLAAASATPDTAGTSGTGTTTTTTTSGSGSTGGSGGGTGGATGTQPVSAALDSSSYTIAAGQAVTFTAMIRGSYGAPTGSASFQDSGVPLAGCSAVALASGTALCTTSSLSGGTHHVSAVYSGDATYGPGVAGPITETVGASPTAGGGSPAAGRLANLSTRMGVLTGNDVMIGGFVVGGTTGKTLVVRARGPSLAAFGVANALGNPTLRLVRSSDQATVATNDDWQSASNAAQVSASGFAPSDSRESAILVTLPPGAYTAVVSGAGGTSGVGMVEVFEVDHADAPIANMSTRGRVRTGDDVMIGGFVVQGTSAQTVLVRARGPSLSAFGISSPLSNPTLTVVRSSDQAVVATNDDWGSASNASEIVASGLAPSDARESAVLVTLPPGAYTAVVNGASNTAGVAIVEVFAR